MNKTRPGRHYNIPIFIPHLGCPYDCIYCDQKIIANQTAVPARHQVAAIIEQHLSTIPGDGCIEVGFFGGSFTAIDPFLQEDYLRQVQPYLAQGRIGGIRISTRPDCIAGENLDMLARYGVTMIELGVQSMDEAVLAASGRGYGPGDVRTSCNLIQARNFQLGIQLMIGLPADNQARDIATAVEIAGIGPQTVRIYPTLVLTGTHLAALYEQGRYMPLQLQEAVHICKEMFLVFDRCNIPVIRMGLYPGEELRRPGVVQAGPFHSSFGELVEQMVFREQACSAVRRYWSCFGAESSLCIYVHDRDLSKMLGHRRQNFQYLCQNLGLVGLEVRVNGDQVRNSIGVGKQTGRGCQLLLPRADYLQSRL